MIIKYLSPSVVWTGLIVYLCVIPASNFSGSYFSHIPYIDKIVHSGLYAVLSILMFGGLYRQKQVYRMRYDAAIITFWFGVMLGLLIEIIQGNFVESRTFEVLDWLSDGIGSIGGLIVAEKMFLRPKTR